MVAMLANCECGTETAPVIVRHLLQRFVRDFLFQRICDGFCCDGVNLFRHLFAGKSGCINDSYLPSRIVSCPAAPSIPTELIPATIAYYILSPLGINRMHSVPTGPTEHLHAPPVVTALVQAPDSNVIVTIQQATSHAVQFRRGGTRQKLAKR